MFNERFVSRNMEIEVKETWKTKTWKRAILEEVVIAGFFITLFVFVKLDFPGM